MQAVKIPSKRIHLAKCVECSEAQQDTYSWLCGHTFCLRCQQKLDPANFNTSASQTTCALCRKDLDDETLQHLSTQHVVQNNDDKIQLCSKSHKNNLKSYGNEFGAGHCELYNAPSQGKCLMVSDENDILASRTDDNLDALKTEERNLMKQAKDVDESLHLVSTEEDKQVEDVKLFFAEIRMKLKQDFEQMCSIVASYENTSLQVITDLTSTEKLELTNLSAKIKDGILKIKCDNKQHKDHLSFSEATNEKATLIKTMKPINGISTQPKTQNSFKYKTDGVTQWKNSVKQWLQPIHNSLTQISLNQPPLRNYLLFYTLIPKYATSAVVTKAFKLHKVKGANFTYISLHENKLLISYGDSADLHIYNTSNFTYEMLQLPEKILNATWLANGNIVYSTDDGCKVISSDGRLLTETKHAAAGLVKRCSLDIVVSINKNNVFQSTDNGDNWVEIIKPGEQSIFWQIIKVDKNNIFWSIELTKNETFRLRIFQRFEGQLQIHWQDVDSSPMGLDVTPCSLAYDDKASVFILDLKHGNVHSFLKDGVYQRMIISAESAELENPLQMEYDSENQLLYILQENGEIKVMSIKYD